MSKKQILNRLALVDQVCFVKELTILKVKQTKIVWFVKLCFFFLLTGQRRLWEAVKSYKTNMRSRPLMKVEYFTLYNLERHLNVILFVHILLIKIPINYHFFIF